MPHDETRREKERKKKKEEEQKIRNLIESTNHSTHLERREKRSGKEGRKIEGWGDLFKGITNKIA